MKFSEFAEELKTSTFEEIVNRHYNEKDEVCLVECHENVVYEDQDLYDFLTELGAEVKEYYSGCVFIETREGETYAVPSEDCGNRFDYTLPDETVWHFDKIIKEPNDLTKQLLHFKSEGKPLKYLVNYMYSMEQYNTDDVIEKMTEIGYEKQEIADCFAEDFGVVDVLATTTEKIQPDENGHLKIDCVPVVITHNFDSEQPVLLFSSEEAALKYIREDFENEKRISVEENDDEIIEDETYFNEKEGYARLTTAAYPENYVTEWNIGNIY